MLKHTKIRFSQWGEIIRVRFLAVNGFSYKLTVKHKPFTNNDNPGAFRVEALIGREDREWMTVMNVKLDNRLTKVYRYYGKVDKILANELARIMLQEARIDKMRITDVTRMTLKLPMLQELLALAANVPHDQIAKMLNP